MALFGKKGRPGSDFAPGALVSGRYEIIREISRGGMAVIYHARDKTLEQEVALKVLPAELAKSRKAVENLKREARITMDLAHPNIVRLYNFVDEGELSYLVMEYVDGQTLENLLDNRGKLSVKEVLKLMESICAGMQYAHDKGVLHRDIKPSNIMLDQAWTVKITDFGIARKMRNQMHKLTQALRMGTPPYMSPEQLMGEYMDHRSDIYSLGILVYECFNGVPPFSEGSVETQIMLKKPLDLLNVPGHINKAVMKAISKHSENRWDRAQDLFEALSGRREIPEELAVVPREGRKRAAPPAAPPSAKPKVLIVDDESDIRTLLRAVLSVSVYAVEDAQDGQEAADKLAQRKFDLVISDIYMPNMDGIQLLKHMREKEIMLPVVIVTASTAEKDILEGYNWGADYYLTKPFDNERLLEIVTELTRGQSL
jgi:serine/threonine protein kinase